MRSVNDAVAVLTNPRFHTPTIKPLRADLARAAKAITELYNAQLNATAILRGDGATVAILKIRLREKHLLPISRRARLLLKGYPGIEESLRIPHKRANAEAYVVATNRMVKALRPHAAHFVAAGLPKDFLVECQRAARVLKERDANPDTARSRRSRATRTLPEALRDARQIIASIDAHINAELGDDETLTAPWRAARRVPARIGRPPKGRRNRPA
jgi:hypothetical protein